ncbi:MAG: type VI secretion system baseplate subunit TssG [Gammaproteobacteria bacterium]
MADTDRKTPYSVIEQHLHEDPFSFNFLNAMRMIECAHPEKPRLGTSQRPADDPVRLTQEPSLAFESSTITAFDHGEDGQAPRLQSRFLGVFGPNGPLPLHLTEYARDRIRHHHDSTFAGFADIFHHRMLSLFYRAWANAEPTVHYDRPQSDRFARYVGSTFGLGMETLFGLDPVPDRYKLHFAGLLACQTRHPEGLESMLICYFRVPFVVAEFVGEWLDLPQNGLWRLGESQLTGVLGESVVVGARVFSCQSKFRLRIGPVNLKQYHSFLPGGVCLEHLLALVRNYAGDEIAWDLNLILLKDEVPPLVVDGSCQLGWTTWLGERRDESDADDLLLNPLIKLQ